MEKKEGRKGRDPDSKRDLAARKREPERISERDA